LFFLWRESNGGARIFSRKFLRAGAQASRARRREREPRATTDPNTDPSLYLLFSPPSDDEFLGRAQGLVLAVDAAVPAAGTSHPFLQFRTHPRYVFLPHLRRFDRDDPANPLIARERRKAFPFRQSPGIGCQRFSQVRRQGVRHASGDPFCHGYSIVKFRKGCCEDIILTTVAGRIVQHASENLLQPFLTDEGLHESIGKISLGLRENISCFKVIKAERIIMRIIISDSSR